MFDFEPSETDIQRSCYMSLANAIDNLSEFQSKMRSIALVASECGNKNICNEALAASDVIGDCRNSFMLLQDKVIRDLRDGKE